jgi:phosphohistidine phosphatase
MRRLVIIRHAKAKRDSARGDHGRELSERGRLQAGVLRSWTQHGGPLAQVRGTVIVSDAARTLETFELGLAGTTLCERAVVDPRLYNGSRYVTTDDVLAAIVAAGEVAGDVIVVGHNPTVLEVTADFAEDPERAAALLLDGFPLAGAAVLAFEGPTPRERTCEFERLLSPAQD